MMAAFLDTLGLAHEDGVIQEENVQPDATKLAPAVSAIRAAYPRRRGALSQYAGVRIRRPGESSPRCSHRRRLNPAVAGCRPPLNRTHVEPRTSCDGSRTAPTKKAVPAGFQESLTMSVSCGRCANRLR
jgi:hypothetical protein